MLGKLLYKEYDSLDLVRVTWYDNIPLATFILFCEYNP